jgi:hypothetical protein
MKRKFEELSESEESDNDSTSTYEPSLIETDSEEESSDESSEEESSEEESSEEESSDEEEEEEEEEFNFCIYKIISKNENDINIYIGSTNNFERRKEQHEKAVDNKNNIQYWCLLYRYIRNNGGWDNFIMEKILECDVSDRVSGLLLETEYIINYKATLNTVFPITDFQDRMNNI